MLRSQLADLWKSRVQHLRQYYCFHGHKPKQRSFPTISRHVWFIPLILTLWWLLIAVIFLYTLKMEHLLSTGEILRYELYLYFLLTILWWKLAVTESEGTTKTRFRNGPHCSCTMCTNHRNGCTIARGNVSMMILPLRDNWKCYQRRRVLRTVHYSDHQVVTSLLLILAGDVETNPGPGIDADDATILDLDDINEVMDELKNVLARYEGIGERLDIPNGKLEEICEQHLSPAAAMRRVITEWLKRNYPTSCFKPPTWKALVDSVEHPVGGNNTAEAEEIASRHRPNIDVKTLLSELAKVQTKWFEIGIQLGIKRNKLATFERDHPSTPRRFLATVSYWLDGNTNIPVSWESVVTVLNDPFVDESGIAKQIQEKYCPKYWSKKELVTSTYTSLEQSRGKSENTITASPERKSVSKPDDESDDGELSHKKKIVSRRSDDMPTMMDIICFPLQDSKVDLTKEVGTKYLHFGILLLEDQTGARISAIERELMKNAQDINYRVFQEWLHGNGRQPVSWVTLISVLEDIGLNVLAHLIRERCDTNSEQPPKEPAADDAVKELFSNAMEKGYVTSQSVVILLVGVAGSGKSSFKRVALNLPLQDKRVSTPLAEAAIRSASISRAIIDGDSDNVEWEVVTPEQLLTMLADAIKVGVSDQTAEESSKSNQPSHIQNPFLSTSYNQSDSSNPDRPDPDTKLSEPNVNSHNSNDEFELEDDNLLQLISRSKGSKRLFDVHWVYIIDTGGQPQFLQLLPAFVKNISSCVCFAKLNESLDEKPMIAFFDESGKQCGSPYQSEHSNLQIMEGCVRTIHSKSCLLSERSPSFMIVGTHHDEYEQNPPAETLEMKNSRLRTKLGPILTSNLVFRKRDSLIFPLNCKKPEKKDLIVVSEFRKCVMKNCMEPESIPLAWFVLEQHIRQYAAKKNMLYVTRSACSKISKKLNMSDRIFEAALNHLLKLNIFRSYSSLPELIFCDTQVVLLKLTELVQHSFKLQGTDVIGPTYEELMFTNKGFINIQFLRKFPLFYSDIFTPENFLDILRELLAIADMKNEIYFMPSLLKELSESEVQSYRCNSKLLSPLLLYLDGGCLPNGLFTSLIAALNNDHNWSPSLIDEEPACLYRNCVEFSIPGGVPGSVTLIASFECIEIHIDCMFESELADICHRVFDDVKNGLEASWKVLYPGDISFKAAFFCNCTATDRKHKSIISQCGKYETCSINTSHGIHTESDKKQHWMQIIRKNYPTRNPEACADAAAMSETTTQSIEENRQSSFGYTKSSQELQATLPPCVRPYLERQLDWGHEGVEKDLSKIAEHLTNWEEIASHLELTPTDIYDIREKYQDKPPLQRQAALRTWKSKCLLQATYKNLLEVFVKAKRSQCAQAVCEVLEKKHPTACECDCSKLPSCEDPPPSKRRK